MNENKIRGIMNWKIKMNLEILRNLQIFWKKNKKFEWFDDLMIWKLKKRKITNKMKIFEIYQNLIGGPLLFVFICKIIICYGHIIMQVGDTCDDFL